jgi:magnesium chelatase subunit D
LSVAIGAWEDASLAAFLFAIDPAGTGGVSLHAHAGPVRDAWLANLRRMLPPGAPFRRTPAGIADAALLGGLDLAATLQCGRRVGQRGLLAEVDGGVLLLAMAERVSNGTAARLTGAMDTGQVITARDGVAMTAAARFGVVALDEGEAGEEQPASALLDRLAFWIDLDPIGMRDTADCFHDNHAIEAARARLGSVTIEYDAIDALCRTALSLGIVPLRPCLLAAKAAAAHAALFGRSVVSTEDAAAAARLVLAPRATILPQDEPAPPPEPEPPPPDPNDTQSQDDASRMQDATPPADIVLEAARAAIPPSLLARLAGVGKTRSPARSSGKLGAVSKGLRGRPAGIREAAPRGGERLNISETLQAAAPWQALRRTEAAATQDRRILIRSRDFRVTTLKQRARTTTIFVVDASGSTAFNRLAEAKGAVELLLADCYRRRDEVAVLAFRGKSASLLLPPTRSLVRAKRSLAELPGGGPTPLAAGLIAGASLAEAVRRGGFTPALVFLTDGSGNIALDGTAARARAATDTEQAGRRIRAAGLRAILVDTSPRPRPAARTLAEQMGALYLPLPYADAAGLSQSVKAAVGSPP